MRQLLEKFRCYGLDLQNEPHRRPESTMDNDELSASVEADTFQTKFEFAARFGFTILIILNHLKQICKNAGYIGSDERQTRNRFEICLSSLSRLKGIFTRYFYITCEEKNWILFDNNQR